MIKNSIPCIALLCLILSAVSPAYAIETGTCDTPAAISAKLADEGHKSVGIMNRPFIDLDTKSEVMRAVMITASKDRKNWYQLTANTQIGMMADEFCVTLKGRDLEIGDLSTGKPPALRDFDFKEDEALAQCEEINDRVTDGAVLCNTYATALKNFAENRGQKRIMQGFSLDENGQPSTLMTFIVNPDDKDKPYRVLMTAGKGATTVASSGRQFSLSVSK